MAEVARNIAVKAGLPHNQVVESEINVAKDHFVRGLVDVQQLEAHVEHVLTDGNRTGPA